MQSQTCWLNIVAAPDGGVCATPVAGGTQASSGSPSRIRWHRWEPAAYARPKPEAVKRFQDVAITHLQELYTYACFLMLMPARAEEVVYGCYLKATLEFREYNGSSLKL